MRNISVTIDRMGKATVSEEFLGYGGEHNAVVLTVSFTEDGYQIYSQADYFRVVVDGVYSDELYISQKNISYIVPQEAMRPPRVHCQIIGYKVSGGEIESIIKSQVFDFAVNASEVPFECVDSQPNVFEKILAECTASVQNAKAYAETARDKSLIAAQSADEASLSVTAASNCAAEASSSATEALSSKISAQLSADMASAEAVNAANSADRAERAATVLDVNNLSNAYKGYQSGSEITLTDVSPLEHEMKVKVSGRESKNLFKPDDDFIQHFEGLSIEWYEDGRFRLYGSTVGMPSYSIGEIQLPAGDYSFSRRPSDWIHDCYLYLSYSDNWITVPEEGCTFTLTEDTTVKIGLNIETNDEFDCVFALQLEEGTEVTEYESPTFGLTSIKVIVKNNDGETVAEYTPNADGTVEGVKSLYPTTVITTDTDGVTIDCEYNRDINKFLETSATQTDINNRNTVKPIVPSNLDYAVKATMCDGKGEEWTDAEQSAARERMGLENTCELIETWTNDTEEPIDFVRTQTPDGTLYGYKRMLIRMIGATKQENWKTINCYLDDYSSKNSFYLYANAVNQWDTFISVEDGFAVMENNTILKEGDAPYTGIAYYDSIYGRRKTIQPKACKKIVKISINGIPAGSTLYIWGTK